MAIQPMVQYLSNQGNGGGLIEMAAAWTPIAPGTFSISPPAKAVMSVYTLVMSFVSTAPFKASDYVDVLNGLVHGIRFQTSLEGNVADSLDTQRIKTNYDWAMIGDMSVPPWVDKNQVLITVNFARQLGAPMVFRQPGDYFAIIIEDDLSVLVSQKGLCFGAVDFAPAGTPGAALAQM